MEGTERLTRKPRVMVAGATGYLGRHLVARLLDEGYPVRALARKPERLSSGGGLASGGAPDVRERCEDVFIGQATEAETLDGLCEGCGVVVSALGKRTMTRKPTVWDVDHRANLNVLERAVEAGVGHFVFVSALGADQLRARGVPLAAAREQVVDAIKESGIAWTIARPTAFFNDMEGMFDMCRKGTGWLIGDGSERVNPIHGADLAVEIFRCIQEPERRGLEVPLGGPDIYTFREILELAFEKLGSKPKIRSVSPWLVRGLGHIVSPFHPMVGGLMRTFGSMGGLRLDAPPSGSHHLADFFEELAGSSAA